MFDDLDDGARVGVWVTLSIITLLLFGLLGSLAVRQLSHGKAGVAPAAVATTAPAQGDDSVIDTPLSGELTGTVFFAMSEAALTPDAQAELAKIKPALEAAAGRKVVLSGFHDPSGDPVKNAELAKERAKAVREALKAAGIDAARIALRKPESTTADGPPEQARRVEIRLVD